MDLLADSPALLAAVCGVLGLMVGSFLNVVVHRLPRMMEAQWRAQCAELRGETLPEQAVYSLVRPRSACPACGHAIRAHENIPVLGWVALRGRCSACAGPIAMRYPLVEAATGLLSGWLALRFGASWALAGALVFTWALTAAALIDLDTTLLPDAITLPLLWVGLLFNLRATYVPLEEAVLGAAAGYLSLWSVYQAFRLATGKEGMGFGDFKLLAAIGAFLGWKMLPVVILLSSVVGASVGIVLLVADRQRQGKPIPFGPYLAAAGLIALLWGDELVRRWLAAL